MLVTFWKFGDSRFSAWEADRGKRRLVPGTVWGDATTLTHDLAAMVVEAELKLPWGFWSCVAAGATFGSTGRRRTEPGRQIIRTHRAELDAAEHLTHAHSFEWQRGRPTPLRAALDSMFDRWRPLGDGELLAVEWPTLRIVDAPVRQGTSRGGRRARRRAVAHGG